jgi:hypothetical protein
VLKPKCFQADCGLERELFAVVLVLKGDFSATLLGPGAAVDLAAAVRWNLCRQDERREAAELHPLCWYRPLPSTPRHPRRLASPHLCIDVSYTQA